MTFYITILPTTPAQQVHDELLVVAWMDTFLLPPEDSCAVRLSVDSSPFATWDSIWRQIEDSELARAVYYGCEQRWVLTPDGITYCEDHLLDVRAGLLFTRGGDNL